MLQNCLNIHVSQYVHYLIKKSIVFTFEENLQFSLMCLEFPFAHSASLFVFELCPSLIARHSLAPSTSVGQPCAALELVLAEECVVLVEVTLAEA